MYIEIHDHYGSKFIDSKGIAGRYIDLQCRSYDNYDPGVKRWYVHIEDYPFVLMYNTEEAARGCYEYLKAFVEA